MRISLLMGFFFLINQNSVPIHEYVVTSLTLVEQELLMFPEHLSSPHVSGALEFASCCQWSSRYSICSFLWRVLWILFVHLSFSFCPSSIYNFRIPLNICFLLKILAHGIGHKLSQQLFKALFLIFKQIIYMTTIIQWN